MYLHLILYQIFWCSDLDAYSHPVSLEINVSIHSWSFLYLKKISETLYVKTSMFMLYLVLNRSTDKTHSLRLIYLLLLLPHHLLIAYKIKPSCLFSDWN